jgi:hypothetical protein
LRKYNYLIQKDFKAVPIKVNQGQVTVERIFFEKLQSSHPTLVNRERYIKTKKKSQTLRISVRTEANVEKG